MENKITVFEDSKNVEKSKPKKSILFLSIKGLNSLCFFVFTIPCLPLQLFFYILCFLIYNKDKVKLLKYTAFTFSPEIHKLRAVVSFFIWLIYLY